MTSLTTYASIPYPVSTDQLVDYPSTAATAAQYLDPLPNTNIILNSAMTIQQRTQNNGVTLANPASGTYIIDGWRYGTDRTAGTANLIHDTSTQAIGDFPLVSSSLKLTGLGMTHTSTSISQRIEDVRTMGGQTVTLSFYAKYTTTATSIATLSLAQYFGTGGTPSATVTTTIASSVALTSSWARYTYTFAVPTVAGKTLGTGGDDHLRLVFDVGSAANYNMSIWGVQLEQRPTVSRFVIPDYASELHKCRRYFYEIYTPSAALTICLGKREAGGLCEGVVAMPTRMRGFGTATTPTFSNNYGTGIFPYIESGSTSRTSTSAPFSTPGYDYAYLRYTSTAGTSTAGTVGLMNIGNGGAATWMAWSAEL